MNETVRFSAETRPRDMRFTIAQFYQMEEAGVFEGFNRTELLDGRISFVNAQHVPHMMAKIAVFRALDLALRGRNDGLEMGLEGSIELGTFSLPEPDLFIWTRTSAEKGAPDGSVRLVVEIADSSERRDLGRKRRIYSENGIPEYWVVVLRTGRVERFADPRDGVYRRHDSFAFDQQIDAVTLPGISLPAGTLAQ